MSEQSLRKRNEFEESNRLKKLYNIGEKWFAERCRRYEETKYSMDADQFFLIGIVLRKEEDLYRQKRMVPITELYTPEVDINMNEITEQSSEEENDNNEVPPFEQFNEPNRTQLLSSDYEYPPLKVAKAVNKNKKVYACDRDGCNKSYTSSFGLRYHVNAGHSEDKAGVYKPFSCPHKSCVKRYKNQNGLKYHIIHFHGETFP